MFNIRFDDENGSYYEEVWPCIPQIGSYITFTNKDYPDDEEMEDFFQVTDVYHSFTKDRSKVLVFIKTTAPGITPSVNRLY